MFLGKKNPHEELKRLTPKDSASPENFTSWLKLNVPFTFYECRVNIQLSKSNVNVEYECESRLNIKLTLER